MKWFVEVAEYAGDDYWYDYPPYEFGNEAEARSFADIQQKNGVKVRRVWSV